ncbi:crocetin glucosyltransferase 3-like [Phalaenopsis equestris]|uniref:crocetin glucosyltransferase 3-like n=1 Tax=Phalaenopsis equestris TaxID=78828 RepID=UPI0009E22318|nr:crocetin glucosyltransferase 3-like [Phalaenopsis equestris]
MAGEPRHIVMLPFMAQGHLIPFLSLARSLIFHHPSLTITLATTPINARNLHSSLSDDHIDSCIHIATLPYSSCDHSLPAGAENTDSVPKHDLVRFYHSGESLRPHFAALLSDLETPPHCIIADAFVAWTVDLARSIGACHAVFTTCGAYGTAAYFSFWLHLPHTKTPSPEFHIPGFPDDFVIHRSQLSSYARVADDRDPWTAFFRRQISFCLRSDVMLCNTAEEVETTGMDLLRKITGLPVHAIGPLLQLKEGRKIGKSAGRVVEWLAGKQAGSVVYVSFGTQNSISRTQMIALARGLEESGKPFVWVLRPPLGFDVNEEFRPEWLPVGFEERMRREGRGMLVMEMAPQLEILSHEATGAFVSHCGWNSVLESLNSGVPIIAWPLAAEQFYNAKMVVEELKVGVEMVRGEEEVEGSEVARVIGELVGGGEKRREMREKAGWCARKMKEAMEGNAVDEFWAVFERRDRASHEERVVL